MRKSTDDEISVLREYVRTALKEENSEITEDSLDSMDKNIKGICKGIVRWMHEREDNDIRVVVVGTPTGSFPNPDDADGLMMGLSPITGATLGKVA